MINYYLYSHLQKYIKQKFIKFIKVHDILKLEKGGEWIRGYKNFMVLKKPDVKKKFVFMKLVNVLIYNSITINLK